MRVAVFITEAAMALIRSLENRSAGPDTEIAAKGTLSCPQIGAATLLTPGREPLMEIE